MNDAPRRNEELGEDRLAPSTREAEDQPAEPTPAAKKPDLFLGDDVELATELAKQLTEEHGVLPVSDGDQLWVYWQEAGIWQPLDDTALSREVYRFSGKRVASAKGTTRPMKIGNGTTQGVLKTLKNKLARPGYFQEPTPGLCTKTSFLQLTAGGLQEKKHDPEHRSTSQVELAHDPTAACPRFEQFLDDVFRDDEDRAEKKQLLQDFVGGCLFGIITRHQKAVVLVGEGCNGKSTLLEIVSSIFPAEVVSAIAPHDWQDQYYRIQLDGMHLNQVNELPSVNLLRTDAFKNIIDGQPIQARKIRGNPVTFRPVAGHLFAANELPGINDQTHALWRRFVLLRFNRRFTDAEKVPGLAKEIIETEAAGILSWAVAGAVRLFQTGQLTPVTSSEAELAAWRKSCDSVATFIEEDKEPVVGTPSDTISGFGNHGWSQAAPLFQEYRSFCTANGYKSVSNRKFAERMKALGHEGKKDRDGRWYPVKTKVEDAAMPGPAKTWATVTPLTAVGANC